jgi:hypothetical protein
LNRLSLHKKDQRAKLPLKNLYNSAVLRVSPGRCFNSLFEKRPARINSMVPTSRHSGERFGGWAAHWLALGSYSWSGIIQNL